MGASSTLCAIVDRHTRSGVPSEEFNERSGQPLA